MGVYSSRDYFLFKIVVKFFFANYNISYEPFKDQAQTALFKAPVRTAH